MNIWMFKDLNRKSTFLTKSHTNIYERHVCLQGVCFLLCPWQTNLIGLSKRQIACYPPLSCFPASLRNWCYCAQLTTVITGHQSILRLYLLRPQANVPYTWSLSPSQSIFLVFSLLHAVFSVCFLSWTSALLLFVGLFFVSCLSLCDCDCSNGVTIPNLLSLTEAVRGPVWFDPLFTSCCMKKKLVKACQACHH